MFTGSNLDMQSEDVNVRRNLQDGILRGLNGNLEDTLQSELELLLREQHNQNVIDRERDLNIFHSGSAPPTDEGSLTAVGGLLRDPKFPLIENSNSNADALLLEEEIKSHAAYVSYYYSHGNPNPRLPPPLLSREDWRVARRYQAGGLSFGGIADLTKKNLVLLVEVHHCFQCSPAYLHRRRKMS